MNNQGFGIIITIGLIVVGIALSAFTVNERELAIKLRVGQVVASDYEPGLHFKIPVYETEFSRLTTRRRKCSHLIGRT